MRQTLTLHPDSRCAAAIRIEAEAARPRPGALALRYVVTGNVGALRLPSRTASTRADGLWRHSCLEAFVGAPPHAAYYEFNFAPSTRWAAYRFEGYRSAMATADAVPTPRIEVEPGGTSFELRATLALSGLPDLADDAAWRLGLCAVIEETNGRKSYWALAHPPGGPDFHHSDCFALELAAASRP